MIFVGELYVAPVVGTRGTSCDISFVVTRVLVPRWHISVATGTTIACPRNKRKSDTLPRPIAKNPIKLIRSRGRALNANNIVARVFANNGIPISG
jgi:hypothetical protein